MAPVAGLWVVGIDGELELLQRRRGNQFRRTAAVLALRLRWYGQGGEGKLGVCSFGAEGGSFYRFIVEPCGMGNHSTVTTLQGAPAMGKVRGRLSEA